MLSEKKIMNVTKNHNPPLQVKWSVHKWFVTFIYPVWKISPQRDFMFLVCISLISLFCNSSMVNGSPWSSWRANIALRHPGELISPFVILRANIALGHPGELISPFAHRMKLLDSICHYRRDEKVHPVTSFAFARSSCYIL